MIDPTIPEITPESSDDDKQSFNRGKILICDDENFNCDIIFGFMLILGISNRKELCEFAYNGE